MIKILHNQSILDLAIQHTGSVENAFTLAIANGKSISDDLVSGNDLELPVLKIDTDIFNYYTAKQIKPATGDTIIKTSIPLLRGIGYMRIGDTFKVS